MRTNKGFKVNSGEARFGKHYKMKGVTLNILDIKISGSDTDNDLAVFEQTGLTPKWWPAPAYPSFSGRVVLRGEGRIPVSSGR